MLNRISAIKKFDFSKILEYSIWGIIFCLPFSKSLVEIFIIVALILSVLQKLKEGKISLKKSPFVLGLILYFAINFLSIFWSTHIYLSIRAIVSKVLEHIILFYIVYEFVDSEQKLKRILSIILCSVFLITINGLIQQFITGYDSLRYYPAFSLWPGFKGYVTSSFPFPNDYATWIITLLPLGITLSFFDLKDAKPFVRILTYVALSLLVYSLYLTKARGAWLAFSVGMVFLGFFKSRKIIIVFLFLAVTFYVFSPRDFKHAITSPTSFKDRIEMWETSGEMLRDRPVRGFGLNTFYENYKLYRKDKYKFKRGSYAHNCYLQQAVEVGIPGLIIFLYLLYSIFKSSLYSIKKIKNSFYSNCTIGIWIGLLSFSAYAFVDTNFYSLPLVVMFWFMTGLLFSTINIYGQQ